MKALLLALLASLNLLALPAATAAATEAYAELGSIRIHYLEAGPKDAAHSLLFVSGWRTGSFLWSKQLDYFSGQGYRVIVMDPRSQGGSTVAQTGNAPEDRAQDIQQLIAKLGLTHLTLVGWSQGVQDVTAYVDHFGTSKLHALALIDAPVSAGAEDVTASPGFVKVSLQGMASFSSAPRAYSLGMFHAIISAKAPPEFFDRLADEAMKTPTDVGISMLVLDFLSIDRRPALRKFDKPTLWVASAQSPLLDTQRSQAATLPQGQFITIEHAAHAVFFDQPEEFDRRLQAFLVSADGGKGK
jgi:microsomal epoxide hydrolase